MPQIQVIGRESVDNQNNLVQQRQKQQEMLQNAEYNRGMLKYNSEHLKLLAKQTDNEVEKMKLQQQANDSDFVGKIFDVAMKSNDPQQTLMTAFSMYPDRFAKVLGDEDFKKRASQLQPSGDERLKSAMADRLSGIGGGAGGNVLIPKMTVGGAEMVFPEDAAAVAQNEQRAKAMETSREASKSITGGIGGLKAAGGRLPKASGIIGSSVNALKLAMGQKFRGEEAPDLDTITSFGASLVQDLAKLKQGGARLSNQDITMMLSFIPYVAGQNKDGTLKIGSESDATYARKMQVLELFRDAMTMEDPIAAGERIQSILESVGKTKSTKTLQTGSKFKVEIE